MTISKCFFCICYIYQPPYSHNWSKVCKVIFDFHSDVQNYELKNADLKNATGVDTSKCVRKADLAS